MPTLKRGFCCSTFASEPCWCTRLPGVARCPSGRRVSAKQRPRAPRRGPPASYRHCISTTLACTRQSFYLITCTGNAFFSRRFIIYAFAPAGGRRYLYPKFVWSPAGGWWNNAPPNWERNTAIGFVALGIAASAIFRVSAANEVSQLRASMGIAAVPRAAGRHRILAAVRFRQFHGGSSRATKLTKRSMHGWPLATQLLMPLSLYRGDRNRLHGPSRLRCGARMRRRTTHPLRPSTRRSLRRSTHEAVIT